MSEPAPLTGRTVGRFVTDLERNLVLDRLSDAFGSGQLTREEFEHRTTRALDARTDLDLSLLTAGLRDQVRPTSVRRPRRTVVDLSPADLVLALVTVVFLGLVGLWIADVARYSDGGWLLVWLFGAGSAALGAFIAGNRRRKL